MYFVYPFNINIATRYDYSIEGLVQWFSQIDLTDIWNNLKEVDSLNPEQLAENLLESSDWVEDLREYCEFTEEENNYLSDEDLINQCREALTPALTKYFTEYWEDLKETY